MAIATLFSVSHHRAIIGGDAMKPRGGPSFNFDETNGIPQWLPTAGEDAQAQSGSLAAQLSLAGRGPLFADGDAFDRGQPPMPLRNGQLYPLKHA